MKTPSNACAITHEWVEFVVQQYEAKKTQPNISIKLTSFNVAQATKPGESFNAELVLLTASAELHQQSNDSESSPPLKKDYSFIVKFLSLDPFSRELIKIAKYHVRELMMYSNVVSDLNSHWLANAVNQDEDQRLCVPEYIYGICNASEYVLVMENCKANRFELKDKTQGLDLEHTMLAVQHIARLHALSRSYSLSSDLCKEYPMFKFDPVVSSLFKPVVITAIENAIKYLRTLPEHKEILAKLEKGRHGLSQKYQRMWDDQSRHQMLCLTHGDYWINNLLFRYNLNEEDGQHKLEDIKLIDWQIAQWSNPVFDLHYLLNTSTTAALRENHLNAILRHYHTTFMSISDNLKTPVPDWNFEQFMAEFGRTSLVGFLMGMCLIQGTLSKAGEKINPNAGSSSGRPGRSLTGKFKSVAAKVIVPVAVRPSSQFIIKMAIKKMLSPIAQELIEGKNTIMNDRFMELLLEAEKKGLLDVLSM
ncbi:EcKinase 1 [Hyalella azteca]|uniref:EcKinase 1 n=1 Tax=Hyalella azteca TaxID=294128 RepID=A0A6A0GR82_HYAAZ|nr:uncharacterized protein LOC108668592 [Hyalella azteca]KAA0185295.1 EcKinase 1 [Hyalella azteca]